MCDIGPAAVQAARQVDWRVRMHVCICVSVYVHIHTCMRACIHAHTYTHTYIHQIELKTDNAWGIIVQVMSRLMQLPSTSSSDSSAALCKYLMLKDPNKPLLNLYHGPLDAFDFEVRVCAFVRMLKHILCVCIYTCMCAPVYINYNYII